METDATVLNAGSSHIDGDLVTAIGPGWVSCADAMPWHDRRSRLDYIVYSPSYGGDLLKCRFTGGPGAWQWWQPQLQVGISGVTHWRLAQDGEGVFLAGADQLPPAGPTPDQQALAELKRWWEWYCQRRGIAG